MRNDSEFGFCGRPLVVLLGVLSLLPSKAFDFKFLRHGEFFERCGKSELFSVAAAEIFSLDVMFNSSVSSLSTKSLAFQ